MYLEVLETNQVTGRTPIKVVLHEIHKEVTDFNKNGIHWKRSHVEKNIDTVNGSPIVAEFLDEDHDMPLGHGEPYIDENGKVYFENSVVVGVLNKGEIQDIEINGEMKTVLVGEGHLFNQRFPKFIQWIKETNTYDQVMSSVEIGAVDPNNEIIYEGGWKKEGRIPMDFQYTGHAILSESPADDSAVLLEINKFKEDKTMSKTNEQLVSELNQKVEDKTSEINKLTQTVEKKDEKIQELNSSLEEKAAELNNTVESLKEKEGELEKLQSEVNELREYKKAQEQESVKAKMEENLAKYEEDEKEVVKEKLETFAQEPSKELATEIINEINSAIAKKLVEGRSKKEEKSEVNSKKDVDIFADVQEINTEDQKSIDELL